MKETPFTAQTDPVDWKIILRGEPKCAARSGNVNAVFSGLTLI